MGLIAEAALYFQMFEKIKVGTFNCDGNGWRENQPSSGNAGQLKNSSETIISYYTDVA